jgi:hypothetical protein
MDLASSKGTSPASLSSPLLSTSNAPSRCDPPPPPLPLSRPPSPSPTPSKLRTDCAPEHRESLECIARHYDDDKDRRCAPHFERYRACRRAERERKLQQQASAGSRGSNDKPSGWFW